MSLPPDIADYYGRGDEPERLTRGPEGRLELIRTQALLERLLPAPPAAIADVGGGAGIHAAPLAARGYEVHLVDPVAGHVEQAAGLGLASALVGDARELPFEDERFALVLATDIVEHVDDDARALAEIRRVLAPGGTAVITVPAFESLWGVQDDVSHHKRRYRKRQFEARLRAAGLDCVEVFYFNYLLFLPIWLARQIIRILGLDVENENLVNTPLINRLLTAIFTLDVRTARWMRAPFGVSILAIARGARHAGVGVPVRVNDRRPLVQARSAAAGAYPRAS